MQKLNILPYFFGFIIALGGAFFAQWLHFPLPWLIGPLLATATVSMLNGPAKSHSNIRHIGQWVIGTSLGLYFTPQTVHTVISFAPYILIGCLFALILSGLNALALFSWGRVDLKTAWFAGAVGGASEMANLAEHYKARVDSVASSHSVRVLIVVICIPFSYKFLGIHGHEVVPGALSHHFSWVGLGQLFALTLIGIWFFGKIHMPNHWVLGPLAVTLLLTSQEIHLTHLTPEIQHIGQLCIGWSLGSKYGPDFFSRAPRYLTVSALTSLVGLCICAFFAYVMSLLVDIPLSTLMLSVSPGGIAEMTITAKVLQLGVPIVASFHVCRMVFILLLAQPCYRLLEYWLEK